MKLKNSVQFCYSLLFFIFVTVFIWVAKCCNLISTTSRCSLAHCFLVSQLSPLVAHIFRVCI